VEVERTFSWLLNDRRHSRAYERLTVNSAAMIEVSMIRLLLKPGIGVLQQLLSHYLVADHRL
jgi:hypothetical protein